MGGAVLERTPTINRVSHDHCRPGHMKTRALDFGGSYLAERSQLCKLPGCIEIPNRPLLTNFVLFSVMSVL